MNRKKLITFIAFAYGISWLTWMPNVLAHNFNVGWKVSKYVAFIWTPWHLPVFFYDKDLSTMGWFGTFGWVIGLVFGSLLLGWLVKQAGFNLWPVILWHGTFNFFAVSDQINPLFPGLMSAMVIATVLWIARRYGENLDGKLTSADIPA